MKIVLFDNDVSCLVRFRGNFALALKNAGFEVQVLVPVLNENEVEMMDQLGLPYENLELSRSGMSPLTLIREYVTVKQKLRELSPDIVFNYTVKPFLLGSFASQSLRISKIYSMLPGLGFLFSGDDLKKRILRYIVCIAYKIAFRFNQMIFVLNKDDRQELLSKGLLPSEKLVNLSGEGVNLDEFQTEASANHQGLSFLFAGRLIREKGVNDFVEAAKILKKKYDDVEFKVAGNIDKNPGSLTLSELEELNSNGVINYIGFTNNIKKEFENTSVFVLPSFYREGLPRSIMESLAMGVPVITTDNHGCRESIVEGSSGYLVPVKSPAKLAESMEKFILNPDQVKKMGVNARSLAESRYDIRKINNQIISYLR
ncbi:MAG: glycosyltransferase family 4 protein [Oligoflexia bacterium]|nr:glycosyltransferase family 4 protein [Oligoflexia bacterium]